MQFKSAFPNDARVRIKPEEIRKKGNNKYLLPYSTKFFDFIYHFSNLCFVNFLVSKALVFGKPLPFQAFLGMDIKNFDIQLWTTAKIEWG